MMDGKWYAVMWLVFFSVTFFGVRLAHTLQEYGFSEMLAGIISFCIATVVGLLLIRYVKHRSHIRRGES